MSNLTSYTGSRSFINELDNNPQIIHARIQRAPKLARLTISHTYNLSLHSLGNSSS